MARSGAYGSQSKFDEKEDPDHHYESGSDTPSMVDGEVTFIWMHYHCWWMHSLNVPWRA